ncbi:hypothetical protein MRX96_023479 [Rhipicephalus microplus]
MICRSAASTVIHLAPVSERCSYDWNRHADTAGSDHYAITLLPCYPCHDIVREYRVVQWPLFRESCASVLKRDDFLLRIADCAERTTTRCIVPAGTPFPDI